jgi:hypothetical protein
MGLRRENSGAMSATRPDVPGAGRIKTLRVDPAAGRPL